VCGAAYDRWAQSLARDKKWKEAVEKYAEGLKAFPGHGRLTNNLSATIDQWADDPIKKKDWDVAISIYLNGLTYLPDDSHLKHNLEYCEQMKKK
jgi:hypothetical protein